MSAWWFGGMVILGAGAILLVVAGKCARSSQRFAARAGTTDGTVVELVPSDGSDFPVVAYRAPGADGAPGPLHQFQSNTSCHFEIGTVDTVYVDPAFPAEGSLESPVARGAGW